MTENINIWDIGAAGGIDSLFINNKKKLKFFLFEPNKIEFKKLVKLYKNNSNVELYNIAISKNKQTQRFYSYKTSSSLKKLDYLKDKKYSLMRVDTNSLQNIKKEFKLPTVDILKIDTEGSEYDILLGCQKLLKNQVLCLKLEFKFEGIRKTNDFFSLNNILVKNNFKLVGISYSESINSYLSGGDLLYFKSLDDPLFRKKEKFIKMVEICDMLGRINYINHSNKKKNLMKNLSQAESYYVNKLRNKLFLLNRKNAYFPRLSALFFWLSIFFMGRKYRTKSAPKLNQLRGFKKFYI